MSNLPMIIAVVPPLFLLYEVYRQDKIEKEPVGLIIKLFFLGCLAVIPTAVVETVLIAGLDSVMQEGTVAYMLIENFLCVAVVEEYFKYTGMKIGSWKSREFDYKFDAIVYAVATSIGFATLENLMYVGQLGLGVALLRAVTAIPGHTIFGVFMGVYYGLAKFYAVNGHPVISRGYRLKAVFIPMLIHGFYDFAASMGDSMVIVFFVFLIIIDVLAIRRVRKESREDFMLDGENEDNYEA